RGFADLRQNARAHHWQVLIPLKAALEVGLNANAAGALDRGHIRSWGVVLRLIFGWNAGGLLRIVDKIRKELETFCWRRKRHRIPIGENQRLAAIIQVRM